MLLEILRRTPSWVFALFFVLLALGYQQSKDRTIGRRRLAILPAVMIALSFYGVLSAFGTTASAMACWLLGLILAISIAARLSTPRRLSFNAQTQSFSVPGSWWPLAGMMAIFFIKYGVGITLARHLPIASQPSFANSISLIYGLLSGIFLARAMLIRRAARTPAAASPA